MWHSKSRPKNIKPIPYLHKDVIEYMSGIVFPDMSIVEFGGGGSTLWFAERARKVLTFETDPNWYEILMQKKPDNVQVMFTNLPYFAEECDLLFIDGEPIELRGVWIDHAPLLTWKWIVLDNANRPEFADARERLKKRFELVEAFERNEENTKYLVTEFWRCVLE